jgi:kumamolisin
MTTKSQSHVDLPGSERRAVRNATRGSAIDSDERFEVTVRLRRNKALPTSFSHHAPGKKPPPLTRAEYVANHGASDGDLAAVAKFASEYGLVVTQSSKAQRSVVLSGTASAFEKAFDTQLHHYVHDSGTYRGRVGAVRIPATLKDVVVGVFGLDNRPFARPHFQRVSGKSAAAKESASFNPTDLARLYTFPTGLDGSGQTIGIIELGGGYRPSDLATYFRAINVNVTGSIAAVSVDGGKNQPGGNADAEVMLDIEVASAIAPGADIAVYFAPDATDRGFLDAVNAAVQDSTRSPSVISISWGGPEAASTVAFATQLDEVFQSAAALGITVCVASGDNGAADEGPQEWDGIVHADFPASSPNVLAVGGTRVLAASGALRSEQVWNQGGADPQSDSFGASGGGISTLFLTVPPWQSKIALPASASGGRPGRGVPDVAADADPASGYNVRVDGQDTVIGGTSAAAPLWAALIALINQKVGKRAGFINPELYAGAGGAAFNAVPTGNNRVGPQNLGYDAGSGSWSACTGLGTPNGQEVLKLLA